MKLKKAKIAIRKKVKESRKKYIKIKVAPIFFTAVK